MENQFIRYNYLDNLVELEKVKVRTLQDLVKHKNATLKIKLKNGSEIIGTNYDCEFVNPVYIDVSIPVSIKIKIADNSIVTFIAPEFQSFEVEK